MAEHSQFGLFRERRFAPYFFTQFLGAFNDNVYKNALIILIAFQASTATVSSDTLINLSAALFILPFFIFSATAGQLADKYEKSRLIRFTKLLEIVIMGLAALGFYLNNFYFLMVVLFLMGSQSTLFGPLKYGILPQHLQADELVGGNGLVEMGTFLAILLGTVAGGVLVGLEQGTLWVSIAVLTIAVLGYFTSRGIPVAPAVDPNLKINWNSFSEIWSIVKFTHKNYVVFQSVLAISWFWFFGATYLSQFPNYTQFYLGGNEQVVTLLLTLFSFGVGMGSLLCERLSGHKVEIGLVPFGSIGLTLFSLDLSFAQVTLPTDGSLWGALGFWAASGSWRVMIDIVLIGLFGGFFIVPLYALVQQRTEASHLSRVIAGNNILNALFMVFSALLAIVLLGAGLTIPQLFLVTALMNAAVAIYIYSLVPEFLMRFLTWILIHTLYRIDKEGLEHIPEQGAAILACNHVSFFDPLVISGCIRRPVRFVMYYKIYQIPGLNFIFRTAGAIPIAGAKENPEILAAAWRRIDETLQAGELLCIFPEGGITRDGELQTFRPGIERALKETPVPVVPMALRGMWGTFFSRHGGAAMSRFPHRLWSKIALKVGEPLPPAAVTAAQVQQAVLALRGDWR